MAKKWVKKVVVPEELKVEKEMVLKPSVDTTGDETELNYEPFKIKED